MPREPFDLLVLSANVQVNNDREKAVRARLRHPMGPKAPMPRIAATQEFRKFDDVNLRGYDKFQSDDTWGAGTAVFLRKHGVEYEGHGFHQLTDRISRQPIGAPRWTTHVDWRENGVPLTLFNCHCPVVSRRSTPDPIKGKAAREQAQYLDALMALADAKRAAGRRVLLVGDFHDRPHSDVEPWEYLPTLWLPENRFNFVRHSVDYISASRRRGFRIVEHTVIPKARTGSDHDWLYATVRVA